MPRRQLDIVHLRGKHGRHRFAFGVYEHKMQLALDGTWLLLRSRRNPADEDEAGTETAEFTSLAEAVNFAIEDSQATL